MQDDTEFQTFHGIPVKTFKQGPLQYNPRPTSAPMRVGRQAPQHFHKQHFHNGRLAANYPGRQAPPAAGELRDGHLAWQTERDMEHSHRTMAVKGHNAPAPIREHGKPYLLDEKGHWIDPEVISVTLEIVMCLYSELPGYLPGNLRGSVKPLTTTPISLNYPVLVVGSAGYPSQSASESISPPHLRGFLVPRSVPKACGRTGQ